MSRIEDTNLNYYEVGGSVRDRLLGREPQDRDFVIVGHTVMEVEDTLGSDSKVVGEDFPVFLDSEGKECAMARTEEKVATGHQGFKMHTSPDVTIEEDLARRDFTINAMARDPDSGEIIDPFDGQDDLDAGVLRHTTPAFKEDPLRVLRLARFAARLDFDIAMETRIIARRTAPQLTSITAERIAEEIIKALQQAEDPSRFFRVLNDVGFGALGIPFPEVKSLKRVPAGPKEYHREGSAFEHTMRVLDQSPDTVRCRLAALAHDLGKVRTDEETLPSHHGHDAEGAAVAERMANRLRLSNEQQGVMIDAAEQHMRFMRLLEMNESTVISLVKRLDRSKNHIDPEELLALCEADGLGREPKTEFDLEKRKSFKRRVKRARKAIDLIGGEEVLQLHNKEPGEWVGDRITELRVQAMRDAEDGPDDVEFHVKRYFQFLSWSGIRDRVRVNPWDPVE